jgi:serine phosphatase RsbU (regulator of sigma subunit)
MERFTSVNEDGSPLEPRQLPGRTVLDGKDPAPLVVRTRNNDTGEERWRVTKSTGVHGPGGEVLLAVNVIEDITDTKRAEMSQRLLADASAELASSLDYRETLAHVAAMTVPNLADGCAVALMSGDSLRSVVAIGAASEREVAVAAEVQATGRPFCNPESMIVVPMATPERSLGVLTLVADRSSRRFGDRDVELAVELGRRMATAVENARLYRRLEHVATTLQRSLLPPDLPDVPGWAFNALYMPAGTGETDVGGDFYDVFPTAAGWMAVMGDVVGRGPAAASLTAMGRYTLRTAGSLVGTPTLGLARLNDNLRERGEMALCTAVVILLREGTNEASLVCAGHPLPYLIRDGVPKPVGRTGPLLGAFEQGHWLPASIQLEPGDVIVLYTDGVTDASGPDDRFGDDRLAAALTGTTGAEDAVDRIRTALIEFAGDEQDDDTAVLAMQKL